MYSASLMTCLLTLKYTNKEARSHLASYVSTSSTDDVTTSIPTNEASIQTTELSRGGPGADFSSDDPQSASPSASYERMILNNKPYLCSIPQVTTPSVNQTTHAQAAQEEAAELARATDRGYDLLRSMTGSCLYFISGWWSYSFCYNAHVKQFHQLPPGKGTPIFPPIEDPATPSYVLGKFGEVRNRFAVEGGGAGDKEAGLPPEDSDQGRTTDIQAKGTSSSRYLSQKLSGGTTCDLTGHPRRVEIQFHCHPQSVDRIGWIKEVSTCSYLMVVYTPRLCNDVAFLPPREERAEGVACREIVKEEDIPAWESRKAADAARKLVGGAMANSHQASRPVVGGIEVGGMALVGREGRRLETPQTVSPAGHNTDTAKTVTLLTQEPAEKGGKVKRLNDKELKAMDLDPGVVDAARRELEDVADGKGWRLEVFETGAGIRELRGVVEGDEGEGEEEYRGDVEDGNGDGGYEDGEGYEEGEEGEGSQEEYKDEL
ncbi:Protein OS-9 [Lecanora helva]